MGGHTVMYLTKNYSISFLLCVRTVLVARPPLKLLDLPQFRGWGQPTLPTGRLLPSYRIPGGANGQRRSCAIPSIWILRRETSRPWLQSICAPLSTSILQTLVLPTLHLPRRRCLPKANRLYL